MSTYQYPARPFSDHSHHGLVDIIVAAICAFIIGIGIFNCTMFSITFYQTLLSTIRRRKHNEHSPTAAKSFAKNDAFKLAFLKLFKHPGSESSSEANGSGSGRINSISSRSRIIPLNVVVKKNIRDMGECLQVFEMTGENTPLPTAMINNTLVHGKHPEYLTNYSVEEELFPYRDDDFSAKQVAYLPPIVEGHDDEDGKEISERSIGGISTRRDIKIFTEKAPDDREGFQSDDEYDQSASEDGQNDRIRGKSSASTSIGTSVAAAAAFILGSSSSQKNILNLTDEEKADAASVLSSNSNNGGGTRVRRIGADWDSDIEVVEVPATEPRRPSEWRPISR